MSAAVRLFAHEGVLTLHVLPGSGQYRTDSVGGLKMPYIARETLSTDTVTPRSSSAALTDNRNVRVLHVQVQPGKIVAIEFNGPNRSVTASADSLHISGEHTFSIGQGSTISVIEIEAS